MNKQDLKKIMFVAVNVDFQGQFAVLAGDLANLIHQAKNGRKVVTDAKHAAALLLWQARCFDGTWDAKMLDETYEWMKPVIVADIDTAYEDVKRFLTGEPAQVNTRLYQFIPQAGDSRFGLLEI